MKINQILKFVLQNISVYRLDYIQVFVLIRLVQFLFIVPVTFLVLKLSLKVTGYTHITEQNLYSFLAHPFVVCMMLLWIFIVLLFIYYEMGFLFIMAFKQQRGLGFKFLVILQQLNRKVVEFFTFQLIYLALFMALLFPLAFFLLSHSLTKKIEIPQFLMEYPMQMSGGKLLYAGIVGLLIMFSLRSVLFLPIFMNFPKYSIKQSFVQSWRFSNRRLFKMFVLLAILIAGHLLMLFGVTVISTLPLYVIERQIQGTAIFTAALTLTFLEIVFVIVFSLLQVIFSQVMVAFMNNPLNYSKQKIAPKFLGKSYIRISLLISVVCVLLSGMNFNLLEKSIYAPDTKIIAHRGYVMDGVENTISGLVSAANADADIIEVDIQQTADGEFVAFHDRTLRRLAGKTNAVANMTLSELTAVTVNANGFSDKITSLDDFIVKAQSLDIALLIELKIHGKETEDFLIRLVDKLRTHKVLDTYYVQSPSPQMIHQLKKLTPNLHVGIVYALDSGTITEIEVDFIALEESSVSDRLIEELQQQDIDLFVWTVNKDSLLEEYIKKGVAGVITDDPKIALEIRSKQDENKFFLERLLNKLEFVF